MPRKPRDPTVAEFALLDHLYLGRRCCLTPALAWRITGKGIAGWRISSTTVDRCIKMGWVSYYKTPLMLLAEGKRAHYRTGMRET